MSLKWIPSNIHGQIDVNDATKTGGILGPMFIFDDVNSYNNLQLTEANIIAKDGVIIREPNRPWRKYLSLRKITKQQQQKWINIGELPTVIG